MNSGKNDEYYRLGRHEMLNYIPHDCKKILDVGCGEGLFGKLVKERNQAEVWGIELDMVAAEKAKSNLDKVIQGDIITEVSKFDDKYFDCFVFNDSLEHLTDPYDLLKKLRNKLVSRGYIVASIPNVRYITNLKELLWDRDWKYKHDGILDFTHYRFFTKRSIIRMFEEKGYNIEKIQGINPFGRKLLFHIFNVVSLGLFSDAKFLQFAIVAKLK